MINRDYSVTIRTLGTAEDKYQRTLDSIATQSIQPKEVIIVLANGYECPKEQLGYERFVFVDKGMVNQRVACFDESSSEYTLALDDDVEFSSNFVASLFDTMEKCKADFVSPLVKEINISGGGRYTLINKIKDWLLGVSIRKRLKDSFMVKVWRTGGFIVNSAVEDNKQYYSQSGHGTCVFGRTKALKELHFEEELWLQDAKYALPEDMVMFYKLYLKGNVIAMNREVEFVHLDAGSSLMDDNKKLNNIYASARNGLIFWHRFIYKCRDKKWLSILCIVRRIFFTSLFALLKGIIRWDIRYFKTYMEGYRDGWKYIHTSTYNELSNIVKCSGGKIKKVYSFGLFHGLAYTLFVLSLRLFPSTRVALFFRKMHDVAVKHYAKHTCKRVVHEYAELTSLELSPLTDNLPIWIFWWQGENEMPPVVKSCLNSVRKYAGAHPVRVVSQHNIDEYLTIPQHIKDRLKQNVGDMMQGMSFIHFSDYVRMALVYEHGGIWLDATCMLTAPLYVPQNASFVSVRTNKLGSVPNRGKWNIYYLGAAKHNVMFGYMKEMLSEYWKNNKFIMDYFFTDYCLSLAYDLYPNVRKMIDALPALNSDKDAHSIYFLLNQAYDENIYNEIVSKVNLHKLTWKGRLNEYTNDGMYTFYGWVLENS